MINRVVLTVFKLLAFTAIGLSAISLAVTTFMFFTTYSKIDSTCKLMQSELSRNNCLLSCSMNGDGGFVSQLNEICNGLVDDTVQSGPTQLFTLKKITVTDLSLSEDNVYVYYENGALTNIEEPAGAYGVMKRIDVEFETNFVETMVTQAGGLGLAKNITTQTQIFSYYAPCLRYIK